MTMQEMERLGATDESGQTRVIIGEKSEDGQMSWHTADGRTLHKASAEKFEIIPTGEILKVAPDEAAR